MASSTPRKDIGMRVRTKCANCEQEKIKDSRFCNDEKCISGNLSKIFAKLDKAEVPKNNHYSELYIHRRIETILDRFETCHLQLGHSNKNREQAMAEAMDAGERLIKQLLRLRENSWETLGKGSILELRVGVTSDITERSSHYIQHMFQGEILIERTSCLLVAALGEITTAGKLFGLLKIDKKSSSSIGDTSSSSIFDTMQDITLKNEASKLGSFPIARYKREAGRDGEDRPGFLYLAVNFERYRKPPPPLPPPTISS